MAILCTANAAIPPATALRPPVKGAKAAPTAAIPTAAAVYMPASLEGSAIAIVSCLRRSDSPNWV